MKILGTLEGQHLYLAVLPQKVGANDEFKAVSVQDSAVLHHRFVAMTKRHIDNPQGIDGWTIPYFHDHSLGLAPGHYRECCAGVKHCPKNLIPNFHEEPESQVLLFWAAPLLSIREFHLDPRSNEQFGLPGQSPLLWS